MNITVTGAQGYIGKGLVRFLARRGHSVIPIDRKAGKLYDIRVTEPAEPPDAVIHLATAGLLPALEADGQLADENLEVVRAALKWGAPRFVFASTGMVYGSTPKPASEATPPDPPNSYAMSKLVCEDEVLNGAPEPVILRLANVVGEADGSVDTAESGHLFPILKEGRKGIVEVTRTRSIRDSSPLRQWVDVAAVHWAFHMALSLPVGVYNVGNECNEATVWEIAESWCARHRLGLWWADPRPGEVPNQRLLCGKLRAEGWHPGRGLMELLYG